MPRRLKAVYHRGVFVPQEPCDIAEGSEVELIIQDPSILSPEVKETEAQQHILKWWLSACDKIVSLLMRPV